MSLIRFRDLSAPLLLAACLLAACDQRTGRAPYLCCVLTCTGGLVKAHKEAPTKLDSGAWTCTQGQPIDYDAPCSTEDGQDCQDDTSGQGTSSNGGGSFDAGGGGSSSSSSRGPDGGS